MSCSERELRGRREKEDERDGVSAFALSGTFRSRRLSPCPFTVENPLDRLSVGYAWGHLALETYSLCCEILGCELSLLDVSLSLPTFHLNFDLAQAL